MLQGSFLLPLFGLLAGGFSFLVLLGSIIPERKPEIGEVTESHFVTLHSGGNVYSLDPVPQPAYAKWFLFVSTCLFLAAIFVFTSSGQTKTHTGVEIPVSQLRSAISHLAESERPFLLGKVWEENSSLQDAALEATPQGDSWLIEISGEFGDICSELTAAGSPFEDCEEVQSYVLGSRAFQVTSFDVIRDCAWILTTYLGYARDTMLEVGVTDDLPYGAAFQKE